MKRYKLKFQGYYRDRNKGNVPAESGIYLVYRSKFDEEWNTILLCEIIYIGQSTNVNEKLANDKKIDLFKSLLNEGEELAYSFAPVEPQDLDIVERSMVFAQKPRFNEQIQDDYDFGNSLFAMDGKCFGLRYTEYILTTNQDD